MHDWDEAKAQANLAKHGVDFTEIARFEWSRALVLPDDRRDYGEVRLMAYGPIGSRLHAVTYTWRRNRIRVINLRKANTREIRLWMAMRNDKTT